MLLCFWLCSIVAVIVLCRVAIDLLQTVAVAVLRLGGVTAVESAVRMECAFCFVRCPTQQFYQHLLDCHSGQMNNAHMESQIIPIANNNTTLINLNQTHLHVQPQPPS